jgi:hypothetical protein
MTMVSHYLRQAKPALMIRAFLILVLALLVTGAATVAAQSSEKTGPKVGDVPNSAQIIEGNPVAITVLDNTQVGIQYTDLALGLDKSPQFFSDYASGVYLWAQIHGTKVFGPAAMPGGHTANAYTPVSNILSGSGTPSDPWVITTVNDVAGTKLRLTQVTTYVNGSEFVKLQFTVQQIEGTTPEEVVLFHAADLESAGGDTYGYFNDMTSGVGGYYTTTTDVRVYQQFVPSAPPMAHQEGTFSEIWDAIGSTSGPGPGFNKICMVDQPLDAGMGMQWAMTVPASGAVTVGNTVFVSPHTNLSGSFSDVPYGSYYYDHVYDLAMQGALSGYADTTFRPMNNTTRAQLCKIIVLAEGWPLYHPPFPSFIDVSPDNPFYLYIETAYHHQVVAGYEDDTFRWGNEITRGQLAKVIVLAENWLYYIPLTPDFNDVPTDHTFYKYIETAYYYGVIGGYSDGTYRPGNSATRGQITKIVNLAVNQP